MRIKNCDAFVFRMPEDELIGFADPGNYEDDDDERLPASKKKSGKKSGGFQNMGLSYPVIKGVQKRGYKIPTPIQRKV